MEATMLLDTGNGIRDYSQDVRPDRRLRFILDRLARYAEQEGCSYISRILSQASSQGRVTLRSMRETLADVRRELDYVSEYEAKPITESAFENAWNDMDSLVR